MASLIDLLGRSGPAVGLLAFYLRQSGVPIPGSEYALPIYLGHQYASSLPALMAAWCGLVLVSVAGSGNLYVVGRRWGRPLVNGRLGALVHLDPDRVARIESWYGRLGWITVLAGAHLAGLRAPVLVIAGMFGVPYRLFALSVAASTGPRVAILLWVGVSFGAQIAEFLYEHQWLYSVFAVTVGAVLLGIAWRLWRWTRPEDSPGTQPLLSGLEREGDG